MASGLRTEGKVLSMEAIEGAIGEIRLFTSTGSTISTKAVGTSDFNVDSGGTLTNTNAIDFTIATGDIGDTADYVLLYNSSGTSLLRIDLVTERTFNSAGIARVDVGALSADL